MDAAFNLEGYTTEVRCPRIRPPPASTVKALEDLGEGEVEVIALLREAERRFEPAGNVVLQGRRHRSSCKASLPRSSASSRWRS